LKGEKVHRLFVIVITACFFTLLNFYSFSDTFYLKNGVTFNGKIVEESTDGIYTIKTGSHTLKYLKNEIEKIEKNDETGEINLEKAKKEWEEKDKILTEKTGLNKDQRAQVEALMSSLQWGEEMQRVSAKNGLLELQKSMDIYPYLEYYLPSIYPVVAPHILEIMFKINKDKTVKILRDKIYDHAPMIRSKAIELLASARDVESYNSIVRGLVDPDIDVCIIACYAVAYIGLKSATPILIENLNHPEPQVVNSCKKALNDLWKVELNNQKIETLNEWKTFWEQHKNEINEPPIYKKDLEPLVDKNFKFVTG